MDEKMELTKPALRAALLQWAQDSRAGKTRTLEETHALPVEQQADESTDHLWQLLGGK